MGAVLQTVACPCGREQLAPQWHQAVATLAAAVVIALCVAWLDRKRAVRYTRSSHDGAAD